MKHRRLVAFVLVGVIIGIIAARMRFGREHSKVVTKARSSVETTASSGATRAGTARSPSIRQRDLVAGDRRYDAFALAAEEELTPKEVFEREPRDAAFAPVMEQRIQSILDTALRELQLEDKIVEAHVECKTLSCYTYVKIPSKDKLRIYNALNGVMLGDNQQPGIASDVDPRLSYVTIYNVYRADTRDDAYYKRFLEEGMRAGLEAAKLRLLNEPKEPHEAPP